jgi:hypothetical protein
MEPFVIAFWAIFLAALVFLWWYSSAAAPADQVNIVAGSQSGAENKAVAPTLPQSFNQPEGLTYSYSGWILVKDFGKGYGQRRTIFKTGDDSPGVYIDSTSNSFIVAVKTFGATETILIPSVPALKWLHLGLVVDQQAVDVYINGTLRQHHTLGQLPKQESTPTIQMGPGWDGVLAKLTYYARALRPTEIKRIAAEPVPDDLYKKPAVPQYFDLSWYIGRFYSK